MWHIRSIASALTILIFAANPAFGNPLSDYEGTLSKSIIDSVDDFPFKRGATELQIVTGPFFHLAPTGNPRPRTDFIMAGIRYGWMLSTPGRDWLLRGNFEFLLEAFGAGIYQGPGNYLVGADMMLRYNFVQPGARLIPYLGIVGGGLYNDVYKTKTQGLLDTRWEFYLGADLGLRWMMRSNLALTGEIGYRHISNNETGDQNLGLNSLGVTLGVSFFY
jgi:lipid A 3-O-deacylase